MGNSLYLVLRALARRITQQLIAPPMHAAAAVTLLAVVATAPNPAAAQVWTGALGTNGWGDSKVISTDPLLYLFNWNFNGYPNSPTANALITAGANVVVNGPVRVGNLTIAPLARLDISTGLTVGSPSASAQIINDGTINVAEEVHLTVLGNVTLSGGGVLIMDNSRSWISNYASLETAVLTISDATIRGAGTIGPQVRVVNQGLIDANVNTKYLQLGSTDAPEGASNTGTLQASNGGQLQVMGKLANTGGTIQALAGSQVLLSGANITGGVLSSTDTGYLSTPAGGMPNTFRDLTLNGTLKIGGYVRANLVGTFTNNGLVDVAQYYLVLSEGDVSLDGTGTVQLADIGEHGIYAENGASRLTVGLHQKIHGYGRIGRGTMSLTNDGVISADVAVGIGTPKILILQPNSDGFINNSLLEARNGAKLILKDGTFTNGVNGTIQALVNSVVHLNGATIVGGSLVTTGSGATAGYFDAYRGFDESSPTLRDLSLLGKFNAKNSTTTLEGTIVNEGIIALQDGYLLVNKGDVKLKGAGTVKLASTGDYGIYASKSSDRLIVGSDQTISGYGQLGRYLMGLTNQGFIDANTDGAVLFVRPSDSGVINTNTMEAYNGGILELDSGVYAGGGQIWAYAGSKVHLNGATIVGGTLGTYGNGYIYAAGGPGEGGATLSGITLADGGQFQARDSITNLQGTILNKGTISSANGFLVLNAGDVALNGTGVLQLASDADHGIYASDGLSRLTIGAGHTLRGAGAIGRGATPLTNQGTISANTADNVLYVAPSPAGVINTGTMQASDGGILDLAPATYTNTGGTIQALAGSRVHLNGAIIDGGTLASSGDGYIYARSGPGEPGATLKDVILNGHYSAQNSTTTLRGSITNNGLMDIAGGSYVLDAAALSNTGTFDASAASTITASNPAVITNGPAAIITIAGKQNWSQGSSLNATGGAVTLKTDAGDPDAFNLAINATGGTITFDSTQHLSALTIAASTATLTGGSSKVLDTLALSLGSTAKLDLNDGNLIVRADAGSRDAVLWQITNWIKSARNTNPVKWTGPGIASSSAAADPRQMTALAVALNDRDGSGPIRTTFANGPVSINDILVKFTWYGDANLDGVVNADDYFQIDQGFISKKPGWFHGDFNYDTVINADDYFLIDSAYIAQGSPLSVSSPSPVPEPTALSLLALLALLARPSGHCRKRGCFEGETRLF